MFVYGNHARKPLKSTIPSGIQKIEKFNEIQVASKHMLIPTYFQVFSLTIMHINPFKWLKIQNCHKMVCGNVSGVDRESNRIIMGFDRQCWQCGIHKNGVWGGINGIFQYIMGDLAYNKYQDSYHIS